MEDDQLLQT